MTTVFVTHDQEEAMEVAEQIVVMNDGRSSRSARRATSTSSPANEFVMGFVGPVNQARRPSSCARTTSTSLLEPDRAAPWRR